MQKYFVSLTRVTQFNTTKQLNPNLSNRWSAILWYLCLGTLSYIWNCRSFGACLSISFLIGHDLVNSICGHFSQMYSCTYYELRRWVTNVFNWSFPRSGISGSLRQAAYTTVACNQCGQMLELIVAQFFQKRSKEWPQQF